MEPEYTALEHTHLDDGRIADVVPLLYGRARLCVGPAHSGVYQDAW